MAGAAGDRVAARRCGGAWGTHEILSADLGWLEDAFYDSQVLRGFAGIELNRDPIPDATTVLHFRHWLERHDLTKGLFDEVSQRWALACSHRAVT